jgi:hypothetical protein
MNALIMNLAQNTGIAKIAKGPKIDTVNELPARSSQDHDLVRAILPNAVECIDEIAVILRRKREWPTIGMKLGDQYSFGISSQLEATVCIQVVTAKCLYELLLGLFDID